MPPLQKEWAMRCPSAFCLHHDWLDISQKKPLTQVLSIDFFFVSSYPHFPFLIWTFFSSLHHFQIVRISTNDNVCCPRGLWGNVKPKTINVRWWAPKRSQRTETLFGSWLSLGPITPLISAAIVKPMSYGRNRHPWLGQWGPQGPPCENSWCSVVGYSQNSLDRWLALNISSTVDRFKGVPPTFVQSPVHQPSPSIPHFLWPVVKVSWREMGVVAFDANGC